MRESADERMQRGLLRKAMPLDTEFPRIVGREHAGRCAEYLPVLLIGRRNSHVMKFVADVGLQKLRLYKENDSPPFWAVPPFNTSAAAPEFINVP